MKKLRILIICLCFLFPLWVYAGTTHVDGNPAGANPFTADGDSLGTAGLEWSDLYLADSAVIYGENDQGNTLTSSATGWTANLNLAGTTYGSDGSITDAEFLYIGTLSSNAQTQLDARCLESVFGTGLGDGLTLSGTDLIVSTSHKSVNQAASVDNGNALTPTTGYMTVHVALTPLSNPSAITISETGATDNELVVITNVHANTATFADVGGQQELHGGTATVEQYETITFKYEIDRWVELSRGTAALGFSTITTVETEYLPISYMIDGAFAPDVLATVTSGTDKVDARTFAGDSTEDVLCTWKVPLDLDTTTGIKYRVLMVVTSATAPSTEGVSFDLSGFSLGDGDALDGTLGTVMGSKITGRSDVQYDLIHTGWSSAMTSTHITNLAVGETVIFKLERDHDDVDDTYVQLIGVIGMELKYQRDHDTTF